jgi:hypothetical protein
MTPIYSKAHREFIKSLPCSVAICRSRFTVPAHTPGLGGARGMRQKRSDFETIPLCKLHHNEQHSIGWPDFISKYELDLIGLLGALNEKPHIGPGQELLGFWTNRYWMRYQDQLNVLTPIAAGRKKAVLLAQEFRRDWLIEHVFTAPKVEVS